MKTLDMICALYVREDCTAAWPRLAAERERTRRMTLRLVHPAMLEQITVRRLGALLAAIVRRRIRPIGGPR